MIIENNNALFVIHILTIAAYLHFVTFADIVNIIDNNYGNQVISRSSRISSDIEKNFP